MGSAWEADVDRVPVFRKIILADRSFVASIGWTLLTIAALTGLRWLIDGGQAGLPFATYFPAIVLTALFLGWKYGSATALVSGMIANRLFRAEPLLFYANWRNASFVALYALIYVLLSLEALSLVIGSVMLFLALAGVMYATRNVEWSQVGRSVEVA